MQNIWGKIIGGVIGLAIGGGLGGALIGILIGHIYDTSGHFFSFFFRPIMQFRPDEFGQAIRESAFTMGVVVLSAKMAKADGRVTRAEIDAFKRVFQIQPDQEERIGHLFDRARKSVDGFEPYAAQLAQTFRTHPAVLEEILGGLFIIAAADGGGLSSTEIQFLKRVAFIFNMTPDDFSRIAAQAGVRIPADGGYRSDTASEPFAILGIVETATNEEIKVAYRALIRTHHPDKLVAEGVAPEFIATANEKMKRINAAYDTVCKMRGIK